MAQTRELTVQNKDGLHLRPAAMFVQKAASFESTIQVRNVTKSIGFQDAKSAIGVMLLKVNEGETIEIKADGADEEAALDGLSELIESKFNE